MTYNYKYYDKDKMFQQLEKSCSMVNDCLDRIRDSKNLKQNYDLLLATMDELANDLNSYIVMAEHEKDPEYIDIIS